MDTAAAAADDDGDHGGQPGEQYEYDVFLSMGGDTRQGFGNLLYTALVDTGIRVFQDKEEINFGKEIDPQLLQVIKNSAVSIPIFSKFYASSKRCLEECSFMMERMKKGDHDVLPVFYDVTPNEVRHQTGSYERAFQRHAKEMDQETLLKWTQALSTVGSLKGWKVESTGYERAVTKQIVTTVLKKLKKGQLSVSDFLVGIDYQVNAVMRMLSVGKPDVRFVGICGMGGIGKTTLSKFIYNNIMYDFDGCSFLPDIQEKTAGGTDGLKQLQSQLVADLLRCDRKDFDTTDEGVNELKHRFREMKVLILLDDVDDADQIKALAAELDWFGRGSIVIITTRDQNVLSILQGHRVYEVKELGCDDSMQLFFKHALGRDAPTEKLRALSKEIVMRTGGLPKALKDIGSLLCGEGEEKWMATLKMLKEVPNKNVLSILQGHRVYEVKEMEQIELTMQEESRKQKMSGYEVFLNFWGPDARQGLVDALYHAMKDVGIRVFRDSEGLQSGDRTQELFWHIEACRIYMAIFSENYVTSRWCLEELAHMVDQVRVPSRGKRIVPIFFGVSPDNVKLKEEEGYNRDLENMVERYGLEKVKRWRDALNYVSKISGKSVGEQGYIDFSKLITKEVLMNLNAEVIGTVTARSNVRPTSGSSSRKGKSIQGDVLEYNYDIFLSFRRSDTPPLFLDIIAKNLRKAVDICFFEDNPVLISPDDLARRSQAISDSRICIPILTKKYASNLYCLLELAEMVRSDKEIIPVFYGVKPSDVRLETEMYRHDLKTYKEFLPSNIVEKWEEDLQLVAANPGWEVEDDGALKFNNYFAEHIFFNLPGTQDDHGNWASTIDCDYDCDVFLSFRAVDSREEVANYLYDRMMAAGVRVSIRNDEKIPIAKKLENLSRVIKNSRICIPIFSDGYASSKWCLRELARMVENGKEIVPIFYNVEPSDVILETNRYDKALSRYQKIFPSKEVKQWKKALQKTGNIKGWELKSGSIESLPLIIEEVLISLKAQHILATDHLIGLEDDNGAMKDLLKLLEIEDPEVRVIGIYGEGGIGKTTLAKAVFYKLSDHFDYHSFLANIRTSSETTALSYLRTQLWRDLLGGCKGNSYDHERITVDDEKFLGDKKVLIILDDVGHKDHIEELLQDTRFGDGSRVIITTRDKSILADIGTIKMPILYEMGEMTPDQALELFNSYAATSISSKQNHLVLAKQVYHDIGGSPLSIEILSSFLSRRSLEQWEFTMQKVEKERHRALQVILEICYEDLGKKAKQIFLDIACFSIKWEKAHALYMWQACNLLPEKGIKALVSMSLIKITSTQFWMHDLVAEFGRGIVFQESLEDPSLRSRVWQGNDGLAILRSGEITTKVELLGVYCDESTVAHIRVLQNMRFLELNAVKLQGDLKQSLPDLKWLSWHDSPTCAGYSIDDLDNLVVLDFTSSDIAVGYDVKELNCLKVLDLSYCRNLFELPSLSKFTILERLVLEGCERLAKIDSSVGHLLSLKYLNIKGCYFLESLPEEISSLTSLEEVFVEGNGGNFSIPKSIGKLKSLLILEIAHVHIMNLPESIGQLKKLKKLCLAGCTGIETLPETLGHLKSLAELDISFTDIIELPWSIGDLKVLKRIKMEYCSICSLPGTTGSMEKLEELYAKGCRHLAGALPESIGNLSHLRVLDLSGTAIWGLPEIINKLSSLETLHLDGCYDLQRMPELSPSSASWFPQLKSLTLSCESLEFCPQLPPNLLKLVLQSIGAQTKFAPLSNLQSLLYLELDGCDALEATLRSLEIDKIASLEHLYMKRCTFQNLSWLHLPLSLRSLVIVRNDRLSDLPKLSGLKNLRRLALLDCPKVLRVDGLWHLSALQELTMEQNFSSLGRPNKLEELKCLRILKIDGWWELENIDNLHGLEFLQELSIIGSRFLRNTDCLWHLRNLRVLKIKDCRRLERINLPRLESLLELIILRCDSLERIEGLKHLTRLQVLKINGCRELRNIDHDLRELNSLVKLFVAECARWKMFDLEWGLKHLTILSIEGCKGLLWIDVTQLKTLQELYISGCDSLTRLFLGFPSLKWLTVLRIDGCGWLEHIDVSGLKSLQELCISDCESLGWLSHGIQRLKWLSVLRIKGCKVLNNIDMTGLGTLKELHILDCNSLKILYNFQMLISLRDLRIEGCTRLQDIDVKGLESLQILHISDCDSLVNIFGLQLLKCLRIISISRCNAIMSLSSPTLLHSLQEVFIRDCDSLKMLKDLMGLTGLKVLEIHSCKALRQVADLPRLISLRELKIHGCNSLEDLGDLSALKELRVVHIRSCERLKHIGPKNILGLSFVKDLCISGCRLLESALEEPKPLSRSALSRPDALYYVGASSTGARERR